MGNMKPDPQQQLSFILNRLGEEIERFRVGVAELEGALNQTRKDVRRLNDQNQFLLKRTHDLNTTVMVLMKRLTVDGGVCTLEDIQRDAAVYAAACAIDNGNRQRIIREVASDAEEKARAAVAPAVTLVN